MLALSEIWKYLVRMAPAVSRANRDTDAISGFLGTILRNLDSLFRLSPSEVLEIFQNFF